MNESLAYLLFSLPYYLQHFFSLFFCFYILKKEKKLYFFIFPILSLFFNLIPNLFLMLSFAQDSHALFWPIVCLSFTNSRNSKIGQVCLLLFLFVTYELAWLLLFILAIFFFLQKQNKRGTLALALSTFILVYIFLIAPSLRNNVNINELLTKMLSLNHLFIISGLVLSTIFILIRSYIPFKYQRLSTLLCVFFYCSFFYYVYMNTLIYIFIFHCLFASLWWCIKL